MPTNTYTPLATLTLTGTDSEIIFASIPNTYRDLILVYDGVPSAGNTSFLLRFNLDLGSNYSHVNAYGSGSSPSTGSGAASGTSAEAGYVITADRTNGIIQLMDYSATDKHKSFIARSNQPTGSNTIVLMYAGRWASTTAVNTISLRTSTGTFGSGSTFSLYGVIA